MDNVLNIIWKIREYKAINRNVLNIIKKFDLIYYNKFRNNLYLAFERVQDAG
jgi:hypothetical protein